METENPAMDLRGGENSARRPERFFVAAAVLCVVAVGWNALVHLVVLRADNAMMQPLRRTDLSHGLLCSLLLTAALCVLFVIGYARVARRASLGEGVRYGLWFGCLAGLLVDLNQYLLYPIPGPLAAKWFLSGLIEFILYGALVTRLYPVRPDARVKAGSQPQ